MIDIFKKLKKLNFPKGEYVVVGGAMEAHGIRKAHDLDILVTPNLYKELLSQRWKSCICEKCIQLGRLMLKKDDVDILPYFMFNNYIGNLKSLIKNADMIKGYPFIKLTELIKFKKEMARPKDLDDIRLMRDYLKKRKTKNN